MQRDEKGIIEKEHTLQAISYNAPKPSKTWGAWGKIIGARVLFPPILLWDATKFVVNSLIGEAVGKKILPVQGRVFFQNIIDNQLKEKGDNLDYKNFTIQTHDNAYLDTFQFSYNNNNNNNNDSPSQKQYIINFNGNNTNCEQILSEMIKDAKELKCDVIGFNFRGVGESRGAPKSKDDLITDGIAQVQRLLDDGVDPENITLKGRSLGGGVATLVADHFHSHGLKVNLFNDRSFSNLTNVAVGHIRLRNKNTGHQESAGKKILGWLAKPFIKFGITLVKWEIDAASAFKNLPDSHKEYVVVRSSKEERKRRGNEVKDDPVLTHYGSLHSALEDERKEQKAYIDAAINVLDNSTTFLIREDLNHAREALLTARDHLKERKMVTANSSQDGHNVAFGQLIDCYTNKSADVFFKNFVKRAHEHHEKMKAHTKNIK